MCSGVFIYTFVCACVCARVCVSVCFPEVDCLQLIGHLVLCDSSNPIKSSERLTGSGCQGTPCQNTVCMCGCVCVYICVHVCVYVFLFNCFLRLCCTIFAPCTHLICFLPTMFPDENTLNPDFGDSKRCPPAIKNGDVELKTRNRAASLVKLAFYLYTADSTSQNDS